MYVWFFFFKQKTAYEMRISDWSSDVCSSDLVAFRSHLDGSRHMLTPERSMEIQRLLGSDIVMAFDECPPNGVDAKRAEASMERSMRWAARSRAGFDAGGEHAARSALFGIQQGSLDETLRAQIGRAHV